MWNIFLTYEPHGKISDDIHHAEQMAAIHNVFGGKRGGGVFQPKEFLSDPWNENKPSSKESFEQMRLKFNHNKKLYNKGIKNG